jgi:hypothetical protein
LSANPLLDQRLGDDARGKTSHGWEIPVRETLLVPLSPLKDWVVRVCIIAGCNEQVFVGALND